MLLSRQKRSRFRRTALLAAFFLANACARATGDLTLSYAPTNVSVSAGEPILIELSIENRWLQPLTVDLGTDRKEALAVSISREGKVLIRDRRVGVVPYLRYNVIPGGVRRGSTVPIRGGETYRQWLLLSDWHDFNEPGTYKVEIELAAPTKTEDGLPSNQLISKEALSIRVDPVDNKRLDQACSQLYQQILAEDSLGDRSEFVRALTSVRSPVAVPYLRKLLAGPITAAEDRVVAALEWIANAEAVDALVECAHGDRADLRVMSLRTLRNLYNHETDLSLKDRIEKGLQK